jgi:hypothetical protein
MERNGRLSLIILSLVIKVPQAVKMIQITNFKKVGPDLISLMIHLFY